jgi:hypothetical protein
MDNVFEVLSGINVNEHTEDKNGLTYLTWAWAWAEFKKVCPTATYEVEKFDNLPYVYDENTGYMCYTKVTVDDITYEMWLPVMDGANKSMKAHPYEYTIKNPLFKYAKKAQDGKYYDKYGNEQTEYTTKKVEAATMFDINKTIMRCLVKNLAMFGLGLYIYAGEDLPESVESKSENVNTKPVETNIITAEEVQLMRNLCKQKGLDADTVFPNGIENLTVEQMKEAYNKIGKLKNAGDK